MQQNDLVMLRLPLNPQYEGRQPHYNTWFRVKFIDNDGTFIGEAERLARPFERIKKGEQIKLSTQSVQRIYKTDESFCYKDNVTVCDCPGLCQDNM